MKAEDIGLTPRGTPMPKTVEEWSYLGDLYEKKYIEQKNTNSQLRSDSHDCLNRLNSRNKRILKLEHDLAHANFAILDLKNMLATQATELFKNKSTATPELSGGQEHE